MGYAKIGRAIVKNGRLRLSSGRQVAMPSWLEYGMIRIRQISQTELCITVPTIRASDSTVTDGPPLVAETTIRVVKRQNPPTC